MGLLDDAIREHLELKLRHGAAADEVARQEQEALGPVRREPEVAPEHVHADDVDPDDLEAPTELTPLPEAAHEEPERYPDELDGDADELDGDAAAETDVDIPIHGPGGTVQASHGPSLGETEEWGFEEGEEIEEEESAEDEDVLEQTPEFLSETPEHDRLWFEQKPPRDFDFDG